MQKPIIKTTADGSNTLYVPEIDESYHSTNGAVQESLHIFINDGFHHCKKKTAHGGHSSLDGKDMRRPRGARSAS